VKGTLAAIFRTLKSPAFYKLKLPPLFYAVGFSQLMKAPTLISAMFVAVQLPVQHQHLSQPCSSQSSFLSYTNTYLSHVRRNPTSCPTSTLISAKFVAVKLPVQHQHLSQPCSSQSNFLSYTSTYLSYVRRSPTSCPTPTLVSDMFVTVQLPVLHQYSCQQCSSQSISTLSHWASRLCYVTSSNNKPPLNIWICGFPVHY